MVNFKNIDYLKSGSSIQQQVYKALIELKIFPLLQAYNPILVGTFPIGINIDSSDLDIICQVDNFDNFTILLKEKYQYYDNFSITELPNYKGLKTLIVNFNYSNFPIEIFAQNKPTTNQDSLNICLLRRLFYKKKEKTLSKKYFN